MLVLLVVFKASLMYGLVVTPLHSTWKRARKVSSNVVSKHRLGLFVGVICFICTKHAGSSRCYQIPTFRC